jgi:hypothetical protein
MELLCKACHRKTRRIHLSFNVLTFAALHSAFDNEMYISKEVVATALLYNTCDYGVVPGIRFQCHLKPCWIFARSVSVL